MVVIGFILSTLFGIGLAVLVIIQFALDGLSALFVPILILLVLFIICMIIGMRGQRVTSQIKRFREYRKILDDREFCDVEELAEKIGKTPAYVVKDLKEMLNRRMFLQGHLDKQNKCFMVTNQAYDQYCLAQKSLEEREAKAKAEAAKCRIRNIPKKCGQCLWRANGMLNIFAPAIMPFPERRFRQRFPVWS